MNMFDATRPIKLLDFLATFMKAVDVLGKSDAVAVWVFAFYIEGNDKDTYISQMDPDPKIRGTLLSKTWPIVVNMLIERFLSDDFLKEAHDEFMNAAQHHSEKDM